jgi:hypothetical protein
MAKRHNRRWCALMRETTGDIISLKQREMITALELSNGNVVKACELADVASSTHYRWVDSSPEYRAALRIVERDTISRLEAEADRRALEGVARMKFHRGQAIIDPRTGKPYLEREYSDRMLEMRLRALDPERYRDRHDLRISQDEAELDAAFARLVAETAARGQTLVSDPAKIDHGSDGSETATPASGGVPAS